MLAILEAHKADKKPDPRILSTMPPAQGRAYNAYVERLELLDNKGRAWLLAIDRTMGELDVLVGWLLTFRLVEIRLEPLRHALWETTRSRRATRPPTSTEQLHLRVEEALDGLALFAIGERDFDPTHTEAGSLAATVVQRLRARVQQHWQELRVIEDEARAVAEELDCEDALMPEVRDLLQRCRERLEALAHDRIALATPIELPEPDDELREVAAKLFGED